MHARLLGGILALILVRGLIGPAEAIGPITSISITPAQEKLDAGSTQTFTVEGKDATGAPVDLTANSTFTTTDPRGSTTANVYTAGAVGSWNVTANYNTLTAEATVTVTAGPVRDLSVNPNSEPEYVVIGSTRSFTAEAFDTYDNKVSKFSVAWSVEGKVGSVEKKSSTSATFTATEVGKGRLVARTGDETAFVNIQVTTEPTTTNENVNAVTNANQATNANAATTNTANANVSTNENQNTNAAASTTIACRPWPRVAWIWLFISYLVLLAVSLAALRTSRPSWWWVVPLILTVVALWLYFQYRCYPAYPALPYLILIAAIVGASWFTWKRSESPKL